MNLTLRLPIDRLPFDGSTVVMLSGTKARNHEVGGSGECHDEQVVVPEREFAH